MSDSAENQAVMPNEATAAESAAVPEKPKERIKKPNRPDDAAHKEKTDALQAVSK